MVQCIVHSTLDTVKDSLMSNMYELMQQPHSSIRAIRTKDKTFDVELLAETRRKELQDLHSKTHFFWIRIKVI